MIGYPITITAGYQMRYLIVLLGFATLHGCVVYIPGGVTGPVSDSMTGAEGGHCVAETTKVGDKVTLTGGAIGTVKSLSGTSTRCKDPQSPIRALVVTE